ncbi:MAG: hypothetical protein M3116_03700 [Actinomycetota bacterium]|nr:hypothetical protein [Actinomycetota bacterium]
MTLAGGAFALTACAEVTADATGAGEEPVVKEELGNTDIHTLTLTPQAVERLGLTTAEVEASGEGTTVPYAALIYDHDGDTWVYTAPEPEVFVRAAVEVDRIDGETVHLLNGPEPGTRVVTLGAAELFGAEFETAH